MILTVTGHRPNRLGGYSPEVWKKLVSFAREQLSVYRARLLDHVITGMAQGWDQAIAKACIDSMIPFVAYIPFEGQELAWPKQAQQYYRFLLSRAESVVRTSNGGYSAAALQKRNIDMVDACDSVLALWDGSWSGTGNCVQYAKDQRVPVKNVWKDWSTFQESKHAYRK